MVDRVSNNENRRNRSLVTTSAHKRVEINRTKNVWLHPFVFTGGRLNTTRHNPKIHSDHLHINR